MKDTFHIVLAICTLFLLGFTPKTTQSTQSSVSFKIKNAGINVDGSFADVESKIVYDSLKPEKSSFEGIIKVKSIQTGIDMRDDHLKDSEYFDSKNYPEITFKSYLVKSLDKNKLEITGNLTIKKTTKPIKIIVHVIRQGKSIKFSSSFVINRLNFGVGKSSWTLSDNVTLNVNSILNLL